jgi:hypothetical protein
MANFDPLNLQTQLESKKRTTTKVITRIENQTRLSIFKDIRLN